MLIDKEICIGCESCMPYCPVEAIAVVEDLADIDQDLCVECGVCLKRPTPVVKHPAYSITALNIRLGYGEINPVCRKRSPGYAFAGYSIQNARL